MEAGLLLLLGGSVVALPAHGISPLPALQPQIDQIRQVAGQGGVNALLPVLAQTWGEQKPTQQFPLQGLPFPAMSFPVQPAPAAEPQQTKSQQTDALPATVNMAKCQVPQNLTFCTGVSWPVPYQGWTEWEVYVEQNLEYYMNYIYDDADDDGRNTTIVITEECRTAMKAIGCAFYFPKCDYQDLPILPCKTLCTKWKKDLACPGSDTYSCTASNGVSASFAGQGRCTDYSEGGGASKKAEKAEALAEKHTVNLVVNTVNDIPKQEDMPKQEQQLASPPAEKRQVPDEEAEET